jgi:hypothetical protein
MASVYTGIDFDLIVQALDEELNPIDLASTDILAYGCILFENDGTEIARFSSNGTVLGVPWKINAMIEIEDSDNGKLRLHVVKEDTQGLDTQDCWGKILIQRDATLNGDDKHIDNEHWQSDEKVVCQLKKSIDDSVINMI